MNAVATETCVPTADPTAMLNAFVSHIENDHDVALETDETGARYIENAGFRITLAATDAGLRIHLAGPNPNMMVFFKDAIAQHVAEFDEAIAKSLRWTGETSVTGDLPDNFRILTLKRKSSPMPGLVRATVNVEDETMFETDGLHLRLMLPANPGREPIWPSMGANGAPVWPQGEDSLHARYITIRHARPDDRELDLDVVSHGEGLISGWASGAEIGTEIGAMGPVGETVLPEAMDYLLIADQTGLPAVARFLETVSQDATGQVICEADGDLRAYLPETKLSVTAVPSADFSRDMRAHVAQVLRPGTTGYALFLGEFQDAQALRKTFKGDLGLGKGQQISAAYWRRGEAGFEA